jgi:hypothetical protein
MSEYINNYVFYAYYFVALDHARGYRCDADEVYGMSRSFV